MISFWHFLGIGLPWIAGVIIYFLNNQNVRRRLFLGVSFLTLLISFIPFLSKFLSLHFCFEEFIYSGQMMCILSGLVYTLLALFYVQRPAFSGGYYALLLMILGALFGVFSASSPIVFYVFWELSILPIFFLGWIYGNHEGKAATKKMIIYSFLASFCLLLPVLSIFLYQGEMMGTAFGLFIFGLLFIAFAIKTPLFPFHNWQADIYEAADYPTTIILSTLLSKLGLFGFVKFLTPYFSDQLIMLLDVTMVLALFTLLYGLILALRASNFKRLMAYVSMSHLALIFLAFMSGSNEGDMGAFFQLFSHGILTLGILLIGVLFQDMFKSQELSAMGGVRQHNRFVSVAFFVFVLAMIGVPLTSGFVGEVLMLFSVFSLAPFAGVIAASSLILGAWVMMRVVRLSIMGESPSDFSTISLLFSQKLTLGIIVGLVFILGVFPSLFFNGFYLLSDQSHPVDVVQSDHKGAAQ